MPRRARLAVAGIPWHIIQRGNNRAACFYCEADYSRFLQDLAEQATRHGCQVHAYCLMTNYVHLLVTLERQDSAGQMMVNTSGSVMCNTSTGSTSGAVHCGKGVSNPAWHRANGMCWAVTATLNLIQCVPAWWSIPVEFRGQYTYL